MLNSYFPILVFIAMGLIMGVVLLGLGLGLGKIMGHARADSAKQSPFECGFEAFEDSRMKFDVRYYLIAILFIIFDLEIAFLFPWAVALENLSMVAFWSMMVFIAELLVGFIYAWRKGAFEWE